MGHIIGLKFDGGGQDHDWLDHVVRSAPHFAECVDGGGAYIFRDGDVPIGGDPTPECEVFMKRDGLEFNWLGGGRVPKMVYDFLVEKLRARFGDVKEEF